MVLRWWSFLVSAALVAGPVTTTTAASAVPGPAGQGRATGAPGAARQAGAGAAPATRLLRPGLEPTRPAALLRPGSTGADGDGPATASPQAKVGTSSNWSGYAASGGRFTRISASWVQPGLTCPGGSQYASFWVGLDGFGSSNSVEQIGSEADCSAGSPRYYAWYELYPAYPVDFGDTVQPGDHLTGSVISNGGGSYTLILSDGTRGWSHTVTGYARNAANGSAEVIAEAPSGSRGVLPLADFGTVSFSGATVNNSPLGSFRPTGIIMVDHAGRVKDLLSPLAGGQNFSVTWQRSD
jgi:hypothetical protein